MSSEGPKTDRRALKLVPVRELGISLGRARCPQPAQLQRMRQSLATHGQLTQVIAVERDKKLELVDGLKRRAVAIQMGWHELLTEVRDLDERAQWSAMLTLNRTTGALSVMEEALVLRELICTGLTQTELAQMLGRHKSWVSRRLGLIDRLHPDLVAWVKDGLMSPGTARRLMVLPAGNQLEMAAVVKQAALSTEDTELLVSLWQKTRDPAIKQFLLKEPRRAIEHARPERSQSSIDPRLSQQGKQLARALPILRSVALRVMDGLEPTPEAQDLKILHAELRKASTVLPQLTATLGTALSSASSELNSAPSATRTSGG